MASTVKITVTVTTSRNDQRIDYRATGSVGQMNASTVFGSLVAQPRTPLTSSPGYVGAVLEAVATALGQP